MKRDIPQHAARSVVFLAAFFACGSPLFSALMIESYGPPERAALNDTIDLYIDVIYDTKDTVYFFGSPKNLTFPDFTIIKSPQKVETFVSNRAKYQKKQYHYVLKPEKMGTNVIESVTIPYTMQGDSNRYFLDSQKRFVVVVGKERPKVGNLVIIAAIALVVLGAFVIVLIIILRAAAKKQKTAITKKAQKHEERKKLSEVCASAEEARLQGDYGESFQRMVTAFKMLCEREGIYNLEAQQDLVDAGLITEDDTYFYSRFLQAYENYRYGEMVPDEHLLDGFSEFLHNIMESR